MNTLLFKATSLKAAFSNWEKCGIKSIMKRIYFDYAATTPIDSKVLEAMLPYLKEEYGNASSIHQVGQKAKEAIDKAREQLASFLNCSPSEIIFTGSATESDNIAVSGVVDCFLQKEKKAHIITTQIEHSAVLESAKTSKEWGAEVDYCPVNKEGLVDISVLEKLVKDNTVLVSIMYANNEIGSIQPIVEIGRLLKKLNKTRQSKIFFHTDAVQAVNYLDCDVEKLGVDLLTLSGHKIYGPKGIGALYIRKGTEIKPLIYGGGQERGIRPGTENVAGIVGLGTAVFGVKRQQREIEGLKKLRNKLIDGILEKIPRAHLNGPKAHRLPNNVNVSFEGAEGEALVIALDQEGIAVSTGSACSTRSLEPSHVLLALGLTQKQAHGSLRLTLGRYTTEQEIDKVLEILLEIVERLRKISGTI